ncbi:hypothetical protein EVAR_58841_1 [Eumeta japonica]|uniref:Gustatory receptor n=1 Tax=Eumeta variegata TaxID=151549 RepID=A0A4C1YVW9_EUMVA|nr:hypothetical protein EVAR_58841_1 [Eumeta japonica]
MVIFPSIAHGLNEVALTQSNRSRLRQYEKQILKDLLQAVKKQPRLKTQEILVGKIITKIIKEMWWINTLFAISLETLNFYLQTLPCRVCDQINTHVKELKATLALHLSSLYLDKEDRRRARSLMAYVEQHDLSFRLLSVAGVGAALPVAVLELTLTYLIILLQFGKLVENQLIVNA